MTDVVAHQLVDLGRRFVLYGRVIGLAMLCSATGFVVASFGSTTLAVAVATILAISVGVPLLIRSTLIGTIALSAGHSAAHKSIGPALPNLEKQEKTVMIFDSRTDGAESTLIPKAPVWINRSLSVLVPRQLLFDLSTDLRVVYELQARKFGRHAANSWLGTQLLSVAVWAIHARALNAVSRLFERLF